MGKGGAAGGGAVVDLILIIKCIEKKYKKYFSLLILFAIRFF
ncbi:hypothetical protein ACLK2I_00360 [Escherichia coli]